MYSACYSATTLIWAIFSLLLHQLFMFKFFYSCSKIFTKSFNYWIFVLPTGFLYAHSIAMNVRLVNFPAAGEYYQLIGILVVFSDGSSLILDFTVLVETALRAELVD